MKCKEGENICINVESTLDSKIKGCGKVEEGGKVDLKEFVLKMLPVELKNYRENIKTILNQLKPIEIESNECKEKPSEINDFIKKMNDQAKSMLKGVTNEDQRKMLEKEIEKLSEALKQLTLCTCSTDKCNGGVQIEARKFTVVLFGLIISKLFMG